MDRITLIDTDLGIDADDLDEREVTDMIVIHHTGNPGDDDLSAEEINESHKGQGWTCIGYHYVIRKNGDVELGRPDWAIGAHAYGENSHTIGIHVCGNFEIAQPTAKQIEACAHLVACLCEDYDIPLDEDHIVGHRDLDATACPGRNLYAQIPEIIDKAEWYASQNSPVQSVPFRFQTVEDVPEWGKATVHKLTNKGLITDADSLDLSRDMLRLLVINDRAGLY